MTFDYTDNERKMVRFVAEKVLRSFWDAADRSIRHPVVLSEDSTIDSGASDSRCPASTREHQRRIIRMKYAQTSSEATGSPKGVRWSHPDF